MDENNNYYGAPTPPVYEMPPVKPPTAKQKKYGAGVVILSAVIAVVIGLLSGIAATAFVASRLASNENEAVSEPETEYVESGDTINTTINVDKVAESVIEAVAEKAGPSVVGIRTTRAVSNFFGGSEDSTGEGSGIIYTADGYIITNYHVIESALSSSRSSINVYLNESMEEAYAATVVGYNITNDLAVIKIDAKQTLTPIELGNSDELKKGQFVAAIGSPGGLDFMGSVSYGIISGLNRSVTSDRGTVSLIQTDAAINPGNSGGALLNIEGKLIGVNSSKIAATEYEGMGFAIPVNAVKEICDNIIARKDTPTPFAGITISETYDEETLNELGYPAGAVVTGVIEDGPADNSGIRRGDIITEFDGEKITDYNDLYEAINNSQVGKTVKVKIYRSGRYYTTDLTLSSNN